MKPAEAMPKPIFQWTTLREIGQDILRYQTGAIPGKVWEVELTSGPKVTVWRADDGQQYFCHGLTFGGKVAPGGAISPYGKEVPTILREHYHLLSENEARPGDIVVFRGNSAHEVVHTGVLTDPVIVQGSKYLDYATRLQSKNGIKPEANLTLEAVILEYGELYNTYRSR